MADQYTASVPPDVTGPDAPDANQDTLILGKFKSHEDLEKAYAELEKKLGKPADADDAAAPAPEPDGKTIDPKPAADDDKLPTFDDASAVLKKTGLDIGDFTREFEKNGELTSESYEKLEKAGFPRKLVDKFIADQSVQNTANQVLADAQINEIKGMAGGEEKYAQMVKWAARNLTAEEQEAYDTIMNTGNIAQIKMAVQAVQFRYAQAYGQDPNLVRGVSKGDTSDVFRSHHEVVQAMRDPRYGKDPAYTREIEQKISRSDVF